METRVHSELLTDFEVYLLRDGLGRLIEDRRRLGLTTLTPERLAEKLKAVSGLTAHVRHVR